MIRETAELVGGLVAHGILIGLPAVAAVLLAMRRGLKSVPLLIGVGLAASGALSYLAFWAYFATTRPLGTVYDFLLFGASCLAIWSCWKAGDLDRDVLRALRTPLLLWIFGSAFIIFYGFLHGGAGNPIPMAALRFSGQLPSDNDIPRYFTEWFATHGHQHPPEYPGEYLFSDRPPLQVGYTLAQRGFFNTAQGLHYQIICVIEQCLWIPAMWAVLVAVPLRKVTRAVAMLAAMLCDIAIVHGFFVWPKLIAAAFLLAALAVILSPEWRRERRDLRVAVLIGVLLALSMLSHGSSVFGVIPLVIFAAFRGVPNWRWLAAALAALLLFYVPWSAYQKYEDPPGNRLLKWQIGGETEVNSEGTLEAIENGYSKVGFDGAVDLKEENFEEMAGWPRTKTEFDGATEALEMSKPGIALEKVRWDRFFSLFPFLGLVLLGPIAMIIAWLAKKKRDPDEWRFALLCFAFFAIACISWGLLLFGTPDSRTTIHVGSLAVPLLGLVGCVVGMRSVYPRLGIALGLVNAVFVLLLYGPSLTPPPGTSYSVLNFLFALLSLGGIAYVIMREARPDIPLASRLPWPASPWATYDAELAAAGGAGTAVLASGTISSATAGSAPIASRASAPVAPAPAPEAPAAGFVATWRRRATGLFPDHAVDPRLGLGRAEVAIAIGAFLALATVLSVLRLGTSGYQTVWAEDGPVYLQSALLNGFWHALTEPYAGYLVMGPRLIGWFASLWPIGDAAAVIAVVSALFAGLSGLAVWFGSAGHIRNAWLRGALVIATALAATAGQETLDSAAYAPWFMLFGTFWLLFFKPRTWWGAALATAFVLLTGLSTPGVWFFLPVAALRIFTLGRDRKSSLVLAGWAVGGLVQIPVILSQEQGSSLWSRHIWTALVQRVIDGGIFGQRLGGGLWDAFGWTFLVVLCIALIAGLYYGLRRGPVSARWFAALALPTSFLMFILSVYQRTVGPNIFWSPGVSGGTSSRYVLVPALIFLSAFVVTLDGVIRDRTDRIVWPIRKWLVAGGVALMLLAVAVSFDMSNGARERPYWHEALTSAANKCVSNDEEGAGIATDPAPFGVYVHCSEIESFAAPALRGRAR
jgi:hypothetical protein